MNPSKWAGLGVLALVVATGAFVVRYWSPVCYGARVECIASDFELPAVRDGHFIRTADLHGKPLVLLFGSGTCPFTQRLAPEIADLYRKYNGRAHFLAVYLREEHPLYERVSTPQGEDFRLQGQTPEDRLRMARQFEDHLAVPIPLVLDGKDNKVNQLFNAGPTRVVVEDASGKVVFATGDVARLRAGDTTAALKKLLGDR